MTLLVIKSILKLCSWLPLSVAHHIGAGIGRLSYRLPNQHKKITITNIALCFPQLSMIEQQKLVRQSLIETGKTFAEMGAMWYWKPEKTLKLIKNVNNGHLIDTAKKAQKGILIITPHLGCWEMINYYMAKKGDFTCMYRPSRLKGLDKTILRARTQLGSQLAPTSASGVKKLYKILKQGGAVGMLPDQNPGPGKGIFAPLFNIPCNTAPLVLRLIKQTNAVPLYVYASRLSNGKGYEINITLLEGDIHSDDPVVAATELNRILEKSIRALPSQYQWGYKKFKYQPDGKKYYS